MPTASPICRCCARSAIRGRPTPTSPCCGWPASRAGRSRGGATAPSGPPGGPPGRGRVRLSGICGSDRATVTGRSSLYFSPLVSWPFVPGHEVVGALEDACDELPAGTRVFLDPVLTSAARGPGPCECCRIGGRCRYDQVATGHLAAGLQTGYCADPGGGWGRVLVAPRSQLHVVPDDLPDSPAVLVEPL